MVQWLGLLTLIFEGPVSIPGRGTKIPQAVWQKKKNKNKIPQKNHNKRDFKIHLSVIDRISNQKVRKGTEDQTEPTTNLLDLKMTFIKYFIPKQHKTHFSCVHKTLTYSGP